MIKLYQKGEFESMYKELIDKSPELKKIITEKVKLFQKNPEDTRLDNHPLTKTMEEKWAFSVTDDIRIVYEWLGESTVRFLAIGGHGKVYKN
ncbi:hypothetical protein A2773_05340 [Candidatus Gottesmanbacteria bacterium RIFCSPHIGHO2_01_FULL_39_10]|uniref:Type II toxin-antitoxin system mRNA interferase toxin, RelE/StbE family n=1 Tax=Candidatus Gottesmanbacteria bacterium RIFCSPHIGHO2_01_FULL_39_10 TaxID=1798375 RepID=A0A1F5ZP77_9BACT|nr:MAG: hypothetical protein A2773_05340 [Candidatus Gottesmanbacteria bacterium RIFCSPHIGHO2_01_FULL_39_10]